MRPSDVPAGCECPDRSDLPGSRAARPGSCMVQSGAALGNMPCDASWIRPTCGTTERYRKPRRCSQWAECAGTCLRLAKTRVLADDGGSATSARRPPQETAGSSTGRRHSVVGTGAPPGRAVSHIRCPDRRTGDRHGPGKLGAGFTGRTRLLKNIETHLLTRAAHNRHGLRGELAARRVSGVSPG